MKSYDKLLTKYRKLHFLFAYTIWFYKTNKILRSNSSQDNVNYLQYITHPSHKTRNNL